MNFKSRLARLGPAAPVRPLDVTKVDATLPQEQTIASPQQGIAVSEAPGKPDVLAELRAKMAAMMGPVEPREVGVIGSSDEFSAISTLPFLECEAYGGKLHQRLECQRASAHVGRIPLSSAREVKMEMLSLLALSPDLAECDPARALYFDTETTGLGGAGALAFLVGLAWFDEQGDLVLEQLLLREPAEERALLRRFEELAARCSMLVSFNGKSFDWPLLQSRRVMNRLGAMEVRPHLDLLHVSRRLHKRRLGSCRLIHLEAEVLGWDRGEDDIPGAEIPARYSHFLRSGDEEALRAVIDHNAWDVLSMAALVGLYGEPLEQLRGEDLLSLTQTLTRAKAFDHAEQAVGQAMANGLANEGLELRARLYKARGDKARALIDFEALSREVDDPLVRFELSKLFEHHAKDFEKALQVVAAGTGEDDEAVSRRRERLMRRASRRKPLG